MDNSMFDRFRMIIFSNELISKQIHSLHLSNANASWQIQPFLPRLSSAQLTDLQSLTLIEMTENNLELIKSVLPFLSRLTSFHYTGYDKQIDEIVFLLPMTELIVLTIPELPEDVKIITKLSSITHLTVSSVNLGKLIPVLGQASQLRHLKAEQWDEDSYEREDILDQSSLRNAAIRLEQLTIEFHYSTSGFFGGIFHQTPHLTTLKIDMFYSDNPIRAFQWEELIELYLPCLHTFKFNFSYNGSTEFWPVQMWFEEFQDDFWVEEHHWHTEYSIGDGSAKIYTIPYISERYILKSSTYKYSHPSINHVDKYNHVTDLVVYPDALTEACQERFPHVTSVILLTPWYQKENLLMKRRHIESLKMVINLSQVTHMNIPKQLLKPSRLLEIF
ncbi:unnamed protein product [Adineta steineri]|uniref:Uncharacterized protein n=1 Tax=Adineta steineri TaxID=433720 RepID=A0A813SY69_9BILA|nr:unnamed protein product [Adineta steineri]CAF4057968.1 unnamed protein product [Adineta steineri]